MKKILMIGIGWEQVPMVKKAKQMGLYVIVTTWWNKKKIPADKVFSIDSRDIDEIEQLFLKEKPDYVIADECDYSMYAVAYLSEKYHIPGPSLRVLTITNNKYLQRECVKDSEVLQPEYKLCVSKDGILDFANKHGYPIMVKPLDNRGSIGISKVESQSEIEKAWLLAIKNSHSRLCLTERCIEGDVVTADGFADSAGYEFIACSTKEMYKDNINVAKTLYYPGKVSNKLFEKIKENAERVADCVGVDYGFVHTEFMIEKDTENIYLIETANRGGGVFISNTLLEIITGLDYCGALIKMSMGQKVNIKCNQQYKKTAILYFVSLTGKKELNIENFNNDSVRIIFVNEMEQNMDVSNYASAGRQGVVVLEGKDVGKLIQIGKKIENTYKASKEELLYIKEYDNV